MLRDGGRIRLPPRSFRDIENDWGASSDSRNRQGAARRDHRRRWVLLPLADSPFLPVARTDASRGSLERTIRLNSTLCARFPSLRKQKCDLDLLFHLIFSLTPIFPR